MIKRNIQRFLTSIQFFTRIPIHSKTELSNEEFGKSLQFAPLTGLIIGVLLALSDFLLRLVLPALPAAVLTLLFYVGITGGLHLDGLGDSFDGLLSGRSRERMLEIMKDSRVGSFGVLAVWFALAINTASILSLSGFISPISFYVPPIHQLLFDQIYFLSINKALVRGLSSISLESIGISSTDVVRFAALCVWPVIGRLASVSGASLFAYVRPEGGLGKSFVEYCGKKELAIAITFTSAISFVLLGLSGFIWVIICFPAILIFLKMLTKPLKGITGDIMGAACEITQVFALLLWMVLQRFVFGQV